MIIPEKEKKGGEEKGSTMGADQSRGLQMGSGLPSPSPISNLSAIIKIKTP